MAVKSVGSRPRAKRASPVQRLLRQQEALASFGSAVFRERSLQKILTDAAEICARGLGVRYCKVLRYRRPSRDLIVQAGAGWHENVIGKSIARVDETSPAGKAYKSQRPIITPDVTAAHGVDLPAIYPDHGIISSVNVVILGTGEEPYGVLEADSDEPRDFDRYDVNFLTGFANVVAEAIALGGTLDQLQASIAERDVLSRELQHRVRNNLQLVWQLLNTQARSIHDAKAKRVITDIAGRVIALGHVYDHLLGRGMSRAIDCGEYLRSLCGRIGKIRQPISGHIQLECHADACEADLDRATTIGLIVNELITNCYEHAFPDGRGHIRVSLQYPLSAGRAMLTVADDGVGAAQLHDPENPRQGIGLVRRLVAQIKGRLDMRIENGTTWAIEIPMTEEGQDAMAGADVSASLT